MGDDYEIELQPNSELLASDFFVTKRGVNGSSDEDVEINGEHMGCHYHGRLVSHSNRNVAISTCDGLVSNEIESKYSYNCLFHYCL